MEVWEQLLNELRAELVVREQELELLHQIDLRLLESEQSPSELFGFVLRRTRKLLQTDDIAILLRRSTYLEVMYANWRSAVGQRIPISKCIAGWCLESDRQITIGDLPTSPHRARYMPIQNYRGAPMRSILATPIRIRGAVVGVLNSESRRPNAFDPVHQRISAAIAGQIAIALQHTQTLDSSQLFADLDRMIFTDADTQLVIQAALEKVMAELQRLEHVEHSGAQIMFLRGDNELEIMHSTNPQDVGMTLQVDKSISGRAVKARRTMIVEDVSKDPDYHRMLGDSIRSEIAVPIVFGDDDIVIGILNVESAERHAFHKFYQVLLEGFAEKVKTLLAFAKLRTDVAEALELRTADELLVAVGDQSSHMVHQINNTVGVMRHRLMELQDMRARGEDVEDLLDGYLAKLKEQAEKVLEMPNAVVDMLDGTKSGVNVNDCVQRAIGNVTIPERISLKLDLGEGIPTLPLYCFDIVVQNLMQNAIDAMQSDGELSISTSAVIHPTLKSGFLELVVTDTGNGISAELQSKMFDLSFTTKSNEGKGLGLGLWWVRNFVRRSRGDITVRSEPGNGTEVSVKIPIDSSIDVRTASKTGVVGWG